VDEEDDDTTATVDEVLDLAVLSAYNAGDDSRYLSRPTTYRKGMKDKIFLRDLEDCLPTTNNQNSWLTDEEFLQKYRVKRDSFWRIVDIIKGITFSSHLLAKLLRNKPRRSTSY